MKRQRKDIGRQSGGVVVHSGNIHNAQRSVMLPMRPLFPIIKRRALPRISGAPGEIVQ
jgi:hypothetical protein